MTSYSSTDIEYKKQLLQIAGDVDKYLIHKTRELENFRTRIKPLVRRWTDYQNAVKEREKALLDHWELVKKEPELQDKSKKLPNEKREWDNFYFLDLSAWPDEKIQPPMCYMPAKLAPVYLKNLQGSIDRNKAKLETLDAKSDNYKQVEEAIIKQKQKFQQVKTEYNKLTEKERDYKRFFVEDMWFRYVYSLEEESEKVFGCWRPKLKPVPENPLDRLKPTEAKYLNREKELQTLPELKNEAERYERDCILLSSVHDTYLPDVKLITKGIWPDDLAEAVRRCYGISFGDRTIFLQCALEQIKQTGDKAEDTEPSDLITLTVAVRKFYVSKTTLHRAIKDKRLKNYKQKTKPKNSPNIVSESEVAKYWTRK